MVYVELLLHNSTEFRIYTREVKLLVELIAKGRIETFARGGDLSDVWPIVDVSFVEFALDVSDINGEGIDVLLEIESETGLERYLIVLVAAGEVRLSLDKEC